MGILNLCVGRGRPRSGSHTEDEGDHSEGQHRNAKDPYLGANTLRASMLLGYTSVALLSFADPARAQDVAPEEETIADIVVTAERRNAGLVDTPISITAITQSALQQRGVDSLLDIGKIVPALRMDMVGANAQPTIRGISSNTTGVGSSPSAAIYVDGVYIASHTAANFDLADVTDVQVLKGPQGTLFGRNATSGAIVVSTAKPTAELKGKFSIGYGSYDEMLANGLLTGPLTDTLGFVLTANVRRSDGWIKNIFSGSDTDGHYKGYSVGGKLAYEPSDAVLVTLQLSRSEVNDANAQVYRIDDKYGANSLGYFIPGAVITTAQHRTAEDVAPLSKSEVSRAALSIRADLGFATLSAVSGYMREKFNQHNDLDGFSLPIYAAASGQTNKDFSQEVILSAVSDVLSWSVGAYYFHDNGFLPYVFVNPVRGVPSTNYIQTRIKTDAYAAFADATYQVVPQLYLTGGLRYSNEKKRQQFYIPSSAAQSKSWDSLTPRAVIRYEFSPKASLYASFTKGFKSGTFDPYSPGQTPVDPETLKAYELGYKYGTRALSFDIAGYFYSYRNLQVTSYVSGPILAVAKLQNAARAEVYGVDAQMTLALSSQLNLRAAAAYTHGEYKSYPGAISLQPSAAGGYENVPADATGNTMLRTPKYTGSLAADYTLPLADGELTASLDVSVTSKIYFDAPNLFAEGSYGIVGGSLKWTSPDEKWSLSLVGRNLLDKKYRNYISPLALAILTNDGPPRTVRATATFRI